MSTWWICPQPLELFDQRLPVHLLERVLWCHTGSATALDWVEPASFDAVLSMNPLYHLVAVDERRTALAMARRALRPGGVVVTAHLPPYPDLLRALERHAR